MSSNSIRRDWLSNVRGDVLAGLVVALALIPEAIAFSIIAGVDPKVDVQTEEQTGDSGSVLPTLVKARAPALPCRGQVLPFASISNAHLIGLCCSGNSKKQDLTPKMPCW